jgi:regulatory protein
MPRRPDKWLSYEEALTKAERYCAYQDRCHSEVRSKLLEWGVYGDRLEEVMAQLVVDQFLDEERFARSYCRGKFRIKRWGRERLRRELRYRKVSDYCIRKGLSEIEEDDYKQALREVLEKKNRTETEADPYRRRQKLAAYAQRKGYEWPLIWAAIERMEEEGG